MSSHTSGSNPCTFCGEHPTDQFCIKQLKLLTGGDGFFVREVDPDPDPEPEYVPITFKLYFLGS